MPTFTQDWFTESALRGAGSWRRWLVPRLAHLSDAQWLEIGSFEGRSALWTVENLLKGENSRLTCVDIWESELESVFDANIAGITKIIKRKGCSKDVLPTLPLNYFHGAYIDGSHMQPDVHLDIRLTLPLLRLSGILVFDDYASDTPANCGVRPSVDRFLGEMGNRVEVLRSGYQVICQLRG